MEARLYKQPKEFKCFRNFQETRNCQSQQECFLIGLLNNEYAFRFFRVRSGITKTLPFFKIEEMAKRFNPYDENEVVDVDSFVKRRIYERAFLEIQSGVKSTTASRRVESYRCLETIHLLIDFNEINDFSFQSRFSNGRKKTVKAETICSCCNDDVFYSYEDIERIGTHINAYLCEKPVIEGMITIVPGELSQFFE